MEITIAIEFTVQFFAFAAVAVLVSSAYVRARSILENLQAPL
jgi:hypothetical protein